MLTGWKKRFWSNFSHLKLFILNFIQIRQFFCIFKIHIKSFISIQFQYLSYELVIKCILMKNIDFRIHKFLSFWWNIQFKMSYQYCKMVYNNFLQMSKWSHIFLIIVHNVQIISLIIVFNKKLCSSKLLNFLLCSSILPAIVKHVAFLPCKKY